MLRFKRLPFTQQLEEIIVIIGVKSGVTHRLLIRQSLLIRRAYWK
jgi:hypothetical protein